MHAIAVMLLPRITEVFLQSAFVADCYKAMHCSQLKAAEITSGTQGIMLLP